MAENKKELKFLEVQVFANMEEFIDLLPYGHYERTRPHGSKNFWISGRFDSNNYVYLVAQFADGDEPHYEFAKHRGSSSGGYRYMVPSYERDSCGT